MGFQVVSGDRGLLLNLSGWTAVLTLKKEIKIPYSSIEEIRVGQFHFPWTSVIKKTGISASGYKAGIFIIEGEKSFLAYHNENEVMMLRLKGSEFDQVVFESGDRQHLVNEILRRCPSIPVTNALISLHRLKVSTTAKERCITNVYRLQ